MRRHPALNHVAWLRGISRSHAASFYSVCRAIVLVALGTSYGWSQDVELLKNIQSSNVRIIEKAEPAVVSIARVRKAAIRRAGVISGLDRFDFAEDTPTDPSFVPNDFGAGVVIKAKNQRHPFLILTNYHVVRGGPVFGGNDDDARFDLWITLADRPRFRSSIVAADPHSDLAVISLDAARKKPAPVALTPKEFRPKKGQFVFALGNPYTIAKDGSASASWGIVSNVLRTPTTTRPDFENEFRLFENVHHFGTLVQVGLALPLGTSGGALIDLDGNLVGITTSLTPLKGYEQSAGYAVPFTPGFMRVLERLTQGYEVEYGFLGVRPANATLEDFDGLAAKEKPSGGAVALSVTANSPAERAGIRPNDVVVDVNGVSVRHTMDLMREVALVGPNRAAKLRIWRPTEMTFVTKNVSLGKWPVQNDSEMIVTAHKHPAWRGIRVDYSTARARYLRGGRTVEFADGVLIVSVDEQRHGLKIQPGDFIAKVGETRVRTPAEFRAALTKVGLKQVTLETVAGVKIDIAP